MMNKMNSGAVLMLTAVALITCGLYMVDKTLFTHLGWIIEPGYAGRLLVITGVILLILKIISMAGIIRFRFGLLLIVLVASDIFVNRIADDKRRHILETSLAGTSAITRSEVVKVNTGRFRKGNPWKYNYIVCKYHVSGTDIMQLYRIEKNEVFKAGQKVDVEYFPGDPRISRLAGR